MFKFIFKSYAKTIIYSFCSVRLNKCNFNFTRLCINIPSLTHQTKFGLCYFFLIAEAIKTLLLLRLTSFVAELNALFFVLIKPITFFSTSCTFAILYYSLWFIKTIYICILISINILININIGIRL